MKNRIQSMAKELSSQNRTLRFIPGKNVFELLNLPGTTAEDYQMVITKISNQLMREINDIKNTYLPISKDMVNKFKNIIANINAKTPNLLTGFEIVEIYKPTLIDIYSDRNIITAPIKSKGLLNGGVSIPKPDNIRDLLELGNPILNNAVQELLHEKPESYLDDIWEKYMMNISSSNDSITSIPYDIKTKVEDILILSVLLKNIKDDVPTGVRIDESKYKEVMKEFYFEVLNYISIFKFKYDEAVKGERLISQRDGHSKLYVNSDVYTKFLEDNTNDVLLGLLLTEDLNVVTLEDLKSKKDIYEKTWEKRVKLANTAKSLNAGRDYQNAYRLLVKQEVEEFKKYNLSLLTVENILEDIFKEANNSDILDENIIIRRLVGKTIATGTVFTEFTNFMQEALDMNPKLTPKDAAGVATIQVVFNYLLAQVEEYKG